MGISESDLSVLLANQARALAPPAPVEVIAQAVRPKRGMNKWECLWAMELGMAKKAGEILWFQFEALRFRLADGAYYKPDFVALTNTGELIAYEVKGMWREAARVRVKVAADRHPFRFVVVAPRRIKDGGGWSEEIFSAAFDALGDAKLKDLYNRFLSPCR